MRFLGMISFLLILTISLSGCPNVTTDILDNVIVSSNTASSDIVSSNNVSSDVGTSNITSTSSDDAVISSDTTSVIYSSKVDSTLNDDKITYKTLNIPMIDDKKFEEWLNFALNLEEAEKFFPKNCISIRSPITKIEPPPSIFEIINVLTDGTKTIVNPETTPGILSGKITFQKTFKLLAPKSCAASITFSSILARIVYMGSIIYGRKL